MFSSGITPVGVSIERWKFKGEESAGCVSDKECIVGWNIT